MYESYPVLLLASPAGGCAFRLRRRGRRSTRGDVVVYVAVPLTGFQANAGQTVLGGARLAAAETNRSGGLDGYKVVVRPLDDQSTDDVAVENVAAIQEAIDKGESVLGVIGHLNSGQTAAAMALYSKMPLVVVTPTASEPSLTQQKYTNFFRANASDTVQAETLSRFLAQKLGAKSVALIFNDTSYGKALAALVKQAPDRQRRESGPRAAGKGRPVHLHRRDPQGKAPPRTPSSTPATRSRPPTCARR